MNPISTLVEFYETVEEKSHVIGRRIDNHCTQVGLYNLPDKGWSRAKIDGELTLYREDGEVQFSVKLFDESRWMTVPARMKKDVMRLWMYDRWFGTESLKNFFAGDSFVGRTSKLYTDVLSTCSEPWVDIVLEFLKDGISKTEQKGLLKDKSVALRVAPGGGVSANYIWNLPGGDAVWSKYFETIMHSYADKLSNRGLDLITGEEDVVLIDKMFSQQRSPANGSMAYTALMSVYNDDAYSSYGAKGLQHGSISVETEFKLSRAIEMAQEAGIFFGYSNEQNIYELICPNVDDIVIRKFGEPAPVELSVEDARRAVASIIYGDTTPIGLAFDGTTRMVEIGIQANMGRASITFTKDQDLSSRVAAHDAYAFYCSYFVSGKPFKTKLFMTSDSGLRMPCAQAEEALDWLYKVSQQLADIGKATQAFQNRLCGLDSRVPLYHKDEAVRRIAGADYSLIGAAMVAEGHHGGLVGYKTSNHLTRGVGYITSSIAKQQRGSGVIADSVFNSICFDFNKRAEAAYNEICKLAQAFSDSSAIERQITFEMSMFYRFVFGCLVESDFLDTESVCDAERFSIREIDYKLDIDEVRATFESRMSLMQGSGDSCVQQARNKVATSCKRAGSGERGIYKLSAPTGSGKTLASIAFAIEQIAKHSLKGVISVAPYTSITDQTYKDVIDVFGLENTIESSSTWDVDATVADEDIDALTLQLKAEDWMCPAVVTTDVQFFDSLFGYGVAKCRKLPAICNRVIIIDELQSISPSKYRHVMNALSFLVKYCGCSVLLMSATLPPVDKFVKYGLYTEDILSSDDDAFVRAALGGRVEIEHIGTDYTPASLSALINPYESTLVVLNTKTQVDEVFKVVSKQFGGSIPVYALSRNMTRVHRKYVLDKVTELLAANSPCILISTTIVEAGINLDFDTGFRCAAGVASYFQTGGRVNRHGLKEGAKLYIFDFVDEGDTGLCATNWDLLQKEKQLTLESLIKVGSSKHYDDVVMAEYLSLKYSDAVMLGETEESPVVSMYRSGVSFGTQNYFNSFDYVKWSNYLRMIKPNYYLRSVFIPFADYMSKGDADKAFELYKQLVGMSKSGHVEKIPRTLRRNLADFSVEVSISFFDELREFGFIRKLEGSLDVWYIPDLDECKKCYDEGLGLTSGALHVGNMCV